MGLLELLFISVGLSMDAFAVAICQGLKLCKMDWKKALTVGLCFGIFQAGMPLLGYWVGSYFADQIIDYDHWVAFILLGVIGGKMVKDSFERKDACCEKADLKLREILVLSVATSIDALAVGVSFAFLNVQIAPAVLLIGVVTLLLSTVGVKIGNAFGVRYKSKAEFFGGIILILMGIKIVLEHTGFFGLAN